MKKILISDTHFGVKQNSLTWLKYQMSFLNNQLMSFIKDLKLQKEEVILYHLGDLFDSRSSISPYVAYNIKKCFEEINKLCDIVIIGGNHDYYSPEDDSIDSIHMTLSENEGFHPTIITQNLFVLNEDLFIPWYKYDSTKEIENTIVKNRIKRVFCHNDLTHIDEEHKRLFKNVEVYSGHIHTPCNTNNLHTLGSTYPLTFADCNSLRGFYVLDDDKLTFYPNKESMRFWRLKNEEIFDCDYIKKDDYVELYINNNLLTNDDYASRIKELSKSFHNLNVIPVSEVKESEEIVDFNNYNIEDVCKEYIPKELYDKFQKILDKAQL
jgi:DNA repair exonuclease SbcCD nuclease subunit